MAEPTPASAGSCTTAILGGGALGLTVALRLAQGGERVLVLEREPKAGGLASGFQPAPELPGGGPYLDRFYHHLFQSDTAVTGLIEELGLGARLLWAKPINALLWQGRIWQPYTPLGLLRFSPLPLVDRLRMGAVLAYLKAQRDYRRFAGRTAKEWLLRWMGPRAFGIFWEPLLRAKFGDRYDQIAMPWFWARIHYRSFALGYLRGGFQVFYDTLVSEIRRLGSAVQMGQEVVDVRYDPAADPGSWWRVTWRATAARVPELAGIAGAGTTTRSFERVVSTLPTRLTIRLVEQLPPGFAARYDWGEAFGAHCVILALDRPLLPHGEYWLNINDPGYPFLVLVEHTNYVPAEEYGGRHLVYLGNYLPMDQPLFHRSKDEILAEFLPAIRRIRRDFRDEWVRESWVFGAPYAQPIVTRDYPEHIPPFRGPLPDLWLGSMFQVYPQDRGQNYSVALGNRLAKAILDEGRRSKAER